MVFSINSFFVLSLNGKQVGLTRTKPSQHKVGNTFHHLYENSQVARYLVAILMINFFYFSSHFFYYIYYSHGLKTIIYNYSIRM